MINFFRNLFNNQPIKLQSFGRTDVGKMRQHNEDSFSLRPDQNLYLVADGMGGHKGGEVASRLAIEKVIETIPVTELKKNLSPEACRHLLMEGFRKANNTVLSYGTRKPEMAGLGCTMIGCLVMGKQAHICHVGDVRGYLIQGRLIRQITADHSLAAMNDNSDESQAKNIVTRCIGVSPDNSPEYHMLELSGGDQILLCSDGLWNMVSDEEITAIINRAASLQDACNHLINRANDAGGRDNITAVLIKVD